MGSKERRVTRAGGGVKSVDTGVLLYYQVRCAPFYLHTYLCLLTNHYKLFLTLNAKYLNNLFYLTVVLVFEKKPWFARLIVTIFVLL